MSGAYNFDNGDDDNEPTELLGWYRVAVWAAFAVIFGCLFI